MERAITASMIWFDRSVASSGAAAKAASWRSCARIGGQTTIKPVITGAVAEGTLVHTDEYSVYARLPAWGYPHKTVCHAHGEYARDEDGDGFCEIHVNTIEGFWSLLRSWLRPHRGISQDKLPLYLGFFQFVHNARRRGKALLSALLEALVT
jgi:transposase-like protein